MADKKISSFTELTTLATNDEIVIVDKSDTTQAASGTTKKRTVDTLDDYLSATTKTLTNKTLTSPVINTGISGTAFKDDDTMADDSATAVASQQSIKAYVDNKTTTAKARAYRVTSNQSIGDSSFTKVQLNAESYDPGSNFDSTTNYRFTAPVDGFYDVKGCVQIVNPVDGAYIIAAIYVNGTEVVRNNNTAAGTNVVSSTVTDTIELSTNDYVELYIYQSSGVNKDLNAGSSNSYMAIHLLSI